MPDVRGWFPSDKERFRRSPDGLQGTATQYGGKQTGQTAFIGCEDWFPNSEALYGSGRISTSVTSGRLKSLGIRVLSRASPRLTTSRASPTS